MALQLSWKPSCLHWLGLITMATGSTENGKWPGSHAGKTKIQSGQTMQGEMKQKIFHSTTEHIRLNWGEALSIYTTQSIMAHTHQIE